MRKKLSILAVFLVLIAVLTTCLFACADGNKTKIRESVVKPDISTALNNYEKLSMKRSKFDAELSLSIYQLQKIKDEEKLAKIGLTEVLSLDRTVNDGKIYLDGTLKTGRIDDLFVAAYTLAQRNINDDYNREKDGVLHYLEGKSHFGLKLGYNDDCYNLKGAFIDEGEEVDTFWGATDNANINNLIKNFKLDVGEINPSEFLMTSGLIDLTDVSDWLSGDAASKYFSTQGNKFIYDLSVDGEKLHALIFDYLKKFAGLFGDEDYVEDVELFEKVLPYLEKWISVGPSDVYADVYENGLPISCSTSLQINVDINLTELNDVLYLLFGEDKNTIMTAVNFMSFLLSLRGTKNQQNTIGITFDLNLTENFVYGAENCALDGADGDMFLPLDIENPDRYVFRVEPQTTPKPPEITEGERN